MSGRSPKEQVDAALAEAGHKPMPMFTEPPPGHVPYSGFEAWLPSSAPGATAFFGVDRTYREPRRITRSEKARGIVARAMHSVARAIFWCPPAVAMDFRTRLSDALHRNATRIDWFKS